jgi:hypothetical protein
MMDALEMRLSRAVESYKFRDIVQLWARERLEHEVIVARVLARGVIEDGLRLMSVEARRALESTLDGGALAGYCARPGLPPVVLRREALAHLMEIVCVAAEPRLERLHQEFVSRRDFRDWCIATGKPLPAFWFESPSA